MNAIKDRLLYMGQASIRITTAEGKVIYIDPYVGNGYEPAADLILVTHNHYDHNGVDKVINRNPDCRIITWREALADGTHQTFDLGFAKVEAVEASFNRWHSVKESLTLSAFSQIHVSIQQFVISVFLIQNCLIDHLAVLAELLFFFLPTQFLFLFCLHAPGLFLRSFFQRFPVGDAFKDFQHWILLLQNYLSDF